MDVDTFIAKYRPDWDRLNAATRRGSRSLARLQGPDLDETVRLYLRASGHLAEAQTRFPDPDLLAYLTALVSRAHVAIYASRATTAGGAASVFTTRYRDAVRGTLPFIQIAAAVFCALSLASGAWVATSGEARAGLIPPEAREAIRHFEGEAVDFGIGPGAVSTLILLNNIQVAVLGFGLGITAGIGTLYVLGANALMLGTLAGAFTAAGKAVPFWALILPHGLLELTAIFIACGAGLRMGWALVDPGDRPRSEALAETAREAVFVVAGVVPAFVLAGLIEGYLTGSQVPAWAQVTIGAVVWAAYCVFVFWPAGRRAAAPRATA